MITVGNPAELAGQMHLIRAHWAECRMPDGALQPDFDFYDALYKAHHAYAVTLWDAGDCQGYAVVLMSPGLMMPGRYAQADSVYLSPEVRRSYMAGKLLIETEQEAKRRGCKRFSWACNPVNGFAEMLERHKYRHEAQLYGRTL